MKTIPSKSCGVIELKMDEAGRQPRGTDIPFQGRAVPTLAKETKKKIC
jgi:hypothetical protein